MDIVKHEEDCIFDQRGKEMTESTEFGRKPLQLQRILSENVVQNPNRLKTKVELKCQGKTGEKENSSSLNGVDDDQEPGTSTPDDTVDHEWFPETSAMSSTMAVGSSLSTPRFFPTSSSNVSSILGSDPSEMCQSSEKHFKTPNRKPIERAGEGGVGELTPNTPRTPRWVSDRANNSRTPLSGGSHGKMSGHLRTTPSSGASQRMSYSNYRTPSSGSSGVKSVKTPSSGSSSTRWNPFDSATSADNILNPTMSPNVFSIVVSPSQESETSCGRFWSIDQQAEMFPANISEESPFKQSIYIKNHSKETENRTQEQIELYFAEHHDITSPPDLPATGPLIMESPDGSFTDKQGPVMTSTWTQTTLTFPPTLPAHVEAVLKQYCIFQEPQQQQSEEYQSTSLLSNSTLRRKLFNADNMNTTSDSSESSDSDEPATSSAPDIVLTPGKVLHTPLTARTTLPSDAWSSSPAGARKHSFSPPDNMLASPMFSPIVKTRSEANRSDTSSEADQAMESANRSGARRTLHHDLTSELYQTAEIHCEEDGNGEAGDQGAAQVSMEVDTVSVLGGDWTMSLQQDSTDNGSKVDTGYATHSITGNMTTDPSSASTSRQDSGMVSSTAHQDNTAGVSVLQPPAHHQPANPAQQQQVLMSYHNDNSNDISVGFPLGSSTPTKK